MSTLKEINEFLTPKKLAIAGASRNPKKFGGVVLAELRKKGYEVYPVHPVATAIDGLTCYPSVDKLPGDVTHLYIVTPFVQTESVVKQAVAHGIQRIWIQQKSDTPEALEITRQNNIPTISGKCMMMFAEPVSGFHGFHRWITKVTGKYPKSS